MMSTSGNEPSGRPALDDEYGLLACMTIFAMMLQLVVESLSGVVFDSRPRRNGC
jgi:hypothetical protein